MEVLKGHEQRVFQVIPNAVFKFCLDWENI